MTGHTDERVTLARLPSGVRIETTVHTYEGAHDGPTLYVQAAQHGREVNGTELLRRFHGRVEPEALAGRIVAVPVADPLTFDRVSYTTPEVLDSANANMNRVWPGDPSGSIHQRMAATLWEYAERADAVVDLHTGSPEMLTHVVFEEGRERSRELAELFGTELLLAEPSDDDATEEWVLRRFDGKFRVAAADAGIPAITPELSHNKQLVEPAIEAGLAGLENLLAGLGMVDREPRPTDPTVARNHLGRVTADQSGLFRAAPKARLGDWVSEGEHLGRLYDPTSYEMLQEVAADRDGLLYSIAEEATVTAGSALVNVAVPL